MLDLPILYTLTKDDVCETRKNVKVASLDILAVCEATGFADTSAGELSNV